MRTLQEKCKFCTTVVAALRYRPASYLREPQICVSGGKKCCQTRCAHLFYLLVQGEFKVRIVPFTAKVALIAGVRYGARLCENSAIEII